MDEKVDIVDKEGAYELPEIKGDVKFEHVFSKLKRTFRF